MKKISIQGYAKINLFLDVLSKYKNGYHEVNTVMQTVSLCDTVLITEKESGITVLCDSAGVPCDEKNLAYRAAELFYDKTGMPRGVLIEIEKKIPVAAGLAGGSADAAATILGLNELYGFPLSKSELLSLGAVLGADVPFCMMCGTAFADGRGDNLNSLSDLVDCYIVVAKEGEGVSTPWAYGELDRIYRDFEYGEKNGNSARALIAALDRGDIDGVCKNTKNIFEDAVIPYRPSVKALKSTLIEGGALAAMMSGSGTAVFGIFNDKSRAELCAEGLRAAGAFSELTVPIQKRL